MNTEHLKYILEIASCESINQAAENLNFQRQYLSKILNSMEKQLGITIFDRNSKGLTLTDAGAYFLEQAQYIVSSVNKLESHFLNNTANYPQYKDKLTFYIPDINTSRGHLIFHVLKKFQKQFPYVNVALLTKSTMELLAAVQENPQTAGVFVASSAIEDTAAEHVRLIPLKQTSLVAIASANNPAAKRYRSISFEALCQQKLVMGENVFMISNTILPPHLQKLLQNSKPHFVSSGNILSGMLEQQQYFSLALYSNQRDNSLLQIPLEDDIEVTAYLCYHRDALRSFPQKIFLNYCLETYHKPVFM